MQRKKLHFVVFSRSHFRLFLYGCDAPSPYFWYFDFWASIPLRNYAGRCAPECTFLAHVLRVHACAFPIAACDLRINTERPRINCLQENSVRPREHCARPLLLCGILQAVEAVSIHNERGRWNTNRVRIPSTFPPHTIWLSLLLPSFVLQCFDRILLLISPVLLALCSPSVASHLLFFSS